MPANHTSSERLLSETIPKREELVQLSNLYNLIKEWTQDLNRHFYKDTFRPFDQHVKGDIYD